MVAPAGTTLAFEVTLAAIFLAWLGLRLLGAFVERRVGNPPLNLPGDALPVYTVIAALYREAASVDGLLRAIEHLDYPGIMAQTPQALQTSRLIFASQKRNWLPEGYSQEPISRGGNLGGHPRP